MQNDLYTREFCSTRGKHRTWQIEVAKQLSSMFKIKSVVDFGCSIGTFLEGFQEAGASVKGYELGYEFSKEFTSENVLEFIEYGDLTEPIDAPISDCSFSIDVAEHIPTKYSDTLVDNMARASKKYIIISAATVGQGGVGHINCQPRSFWIRKFEEAGFNYSMKLSGKALRKIYEVDNVPKWMKNIMVFKKA